VDRAGVVGRKAVLCTYRANGLWKGYNWSLHIYCVGAGERVSCRWAEGMGANNCAMDLAGDKFDKAHYVESCKGARIVEETCLQGSKPISNRRKDRYRKSCLGSSRAVPTSAFIVFQLHCLRISRLETW